MEQNRIEGLAQIAVKYDLSELEVTEGALTVKIKRGITPAQTGWAGTEAAVPAVAPKSPADFRHITEMKALQDELVLTREAQKKEEKQKPAGSGQEGARKTGQNEVLIKAPLAGIFYRQSQPGNPPYAEVGQHVKKGDVLCLVEVMKMINEVAAECDGVVKEFLIENEQFVEYGCPLVIISEA